jgi:hypothetical protein
MISHDEAHRSAREFLERAGYPERLTLVMQPELSQEYTAAWAVRFDSQEHLDTGDFDKAPWARVLIVPKNGGQPHFPPTHIPLAQYMEQLAADQRSEEG